MAKVGRQKGDPKITPEEQNKVIEKEGSKTRSYLSKVKVDIEYWTEVLELLELQVWSKVGDGEKWEDKNAHYRYTPAEVATSCLAYLKISINRNQPLTLTGIAMFMGIRRQALFDLRNNPKRPECYDFIIDICDFVEMYVEALTQSKQNPAGPIFILKNLGWKDKIEIEAAGTNSMTDAEREEQQRRVMAFSEVIKDHREVEMTDDPAEPQAPGPRTAITAPKETIFVPTE